ncbi:MAG: M23 family metallopeptidase [Sulfurimonas sp.]|nr:M23 family metallopeptidase [Sulfurimonas sp.]MDQ7061193.1 M23 family metallopeptidase [Sulfurimonas sp.]
MRCFILLFFVTSTLFSFNFEITDASISNGRTSLIKFKKEKNIVYEKITLEKRTYRVYKNPLDASEVYALIPISYYAKPKNIMATIHYKEGSKKLSKSLWLKVEDGKYKKEEIHVSKSKVNPKGKKVNKRINKEYHEAMNIYATSTKQNYLHSKFILPMDSFITSDFGKARVYNDTLKGYHSGTDFRAKVGTPIIASNDGVVVLSKDRFYSGGTVILDHGQGIYTCYYHMSKLDAKLGSKIKKGEVIGLSGQSGRVTGPHLHFSVRVDGVQVDPLQFVTLMNTNLLNKEEIQ